jgi:branched-chain amino acid transport system substrate-binding protein
MSSTTKIFFTPSATASSASAETFTFEEARCERNAMALVANPAILGVVGTFNSGCAAIEIPILNAAPGGGLAMVSPSNTAPCLTMAAPGCPDDEPARFYPTGYRNYARVLANDLFQSAALAELAVALGVKKIFVVEDMSGYGTPLSQGFLKAAAFLELEIAGSASFDVEAANYVDLMKQVKASGADALFLASFLDERGDQLIQDKVTVLGPNDGAVKLIVPDGFASPDAIDFIGEAIVGAYATTQGVSPEGLGADGMAFVAEFETLLGEPVELYTVPGLQAARVLLDAIAASDGTRAGVIAKLFATHVESGVLGAFTFGPTGDPIPGEGGLITGHTVLRFTADEMQFERVIVPAAATVDAVLAD